MPGHGREHGGLAAYVSARQKRRFNIQVLLTQGIHLLVFDLLNGRKALGFEQAREQFHIGF